MYVTTLNGTILNSPQGAKVLLMDYWTPTEDLRMKQQWIWGFLSGLVFFGGFLDHQGIVVAFYLVLSFNVRRHLYMKWLLM